VCLPIAKQYPNYQVYAFEAQTHVAEMLQENIKLNNLNNISVCSYALGEKNSTISIVHPDYNKAENIGAFSLDPYVREQSKIARGHGDLITIPVKILDDMQFDQPIRCIKLDVEGYEERILLGGLETLRKHNYPPIVYELWAYNDWWKHNAVNLKKLLESMGYKYTQLMMLQ
jgi:FkbM family methyltransferase